MKRIILAAGAALLALYPAAVAVGGSTFSQSAADRMPSQAVVMDDNGGQGNPVQTGDDKGGLRNRVQAGDDNGGLRKHIEAGDDKGGVRDDGPRHA